MDATFEGGMTIQEMVDEGVRRAYTNEENPLRASVLMDPAGKRLNSKDNTPAVVHVDEDAEPFVRKGRNVFHGFCLSADSTLRPGQPCLICNSSGELIGHGISRVDANEMMAFRKGIAIRVRDGIRDE